MSMEASAPSRAKRGMKVPRPLLRMASDERLVAQVRAGSPTAFEAIYDRHHPAILGFCRHLLGSPEDGEDAAQQAFLSAYRALLRDDRTIVLRPWLFTIARNRCYTTMRARRERPLAHEDAAGETRSVAPGPAEAAVRREELDETLQDVARLPDAQREALVLFELGDLSHADIAQVLEREPAQVKSLVFQARSTLIDQREARDIDCATIRHELASARGSALLRGHLRRHTRDCDGCRHFAKAVRRQRTKLAAALPVASTSAFPIAALSGAAGAGTAATAASGGLGLAGGLGGFAGLGGGMSLGGKAVAGVALALAGSTAGVVVEREVESASRAAKPAVAAAATPPSTSSNAPPSMGGGSSAPGAPRVVAISAPALAPALSTSSAASPTAPSRRAPREARSAGSRWGSAKGVRDRSREREGRGPGHRDGARREDGPRSERGWRRHGDSSSNNGSAGRGGGERRRSHRGGEREGRQASRGAYRRHGSGSASGGTGWGQGGSGRQRGAGERRAHGGDYDHGRGGGQRAGQAARAAPTATLRAPARAAPRGGHGSGRGTGPHRHRSGSGGRS